MNMRKQLLRRAKELTDMGMVFNGGAYVGQGEFDKDFHFPMIDLQCTSDSKWDKLVEKAKIELERRKNQ